MLKVITGFEDEFIKQWRMKPCVRPYGGIYYRVFDNRFIMYLWTYQNQLQGNLYFSNYEKPLYRIPKNHAKHKNPWIDVYDVVYDITRSKMIKKRGD